MHWTLPFAFAVFCSSTGPARGPRPGPAPRATQQASAPEVAIGTRSIEDWRAIAAAGYALPEGESAFELLLELSGHFGSPSSELRDELGYGISAAWIGRGQLLQPDELRELTRRWSEKLRAGLPGPTSKAEPQVPAAELDSAVLSRSFSALALSLLAAHDLQDPFLGREGFDELFASALEYLQAETDLRGWVPQLGWVHATAHTADLLGTLAQSDRLEHGQQAELLQAVARRMASGGETVFVHGEHDRVARAVLTLLAREDFLPEHYDAFLASLQRTHAAQAAARGFDPLRYAAAENGRQLMRCLIVRLDQPAELSELLSDLRRASLDAMGRL